MLLKLCAFAIELTLRLCESALVLAEPLGGSDCTAKECFLHGPGSVRALIASKTRAAYDDVHGRVRGRWKGEASVETRRLEAALPWRTVL